MSLEALIISVGCDIVLNTASFANGAVPAGWPEMAGYDVVCFEPGDYVGVAAWGIYPGTAEVQKRYVGLTESNEPWLLPEEGQVIWHAPLYARSDYASLENMTVQVVEFILFPAITTGRAGGPQVGGVVKNFYVYGGLASYIISASDGAHLEHGVLGPAIVDYTAPDRNSGGFSIIGSDIIIRDVEVFDRSEDCFQIHSYGNSYERILIEDFDCYQTGRRYRQDPSGVTSCSEDGFDLKTGVKHANYATGDEIVIRRGNIWGMRRANECALGGGAGHGILYHGPNAQHYVVEDINIWDSDLCMGNVSPSSLPGYASYITMNRVRCLEPYQDGRNNGWGLSLPTKSELVNSTTVDLSTRWASLSTVNQSVRCTNVIRSGPFAGTQPTDMRRTVYYGIGKANAEPKQGESVVWERAEMEDLVVPIHRLTAPDAEKVFRNAVPKTDWRNVLWGSPCDPGTTPALEGTIGAYALP